MFDLQEITVTCSTCGGSGFVGVRAPIWDIMDAMILDYEIEGCMDCAGWGIELVEGVTDE